METKRILGGALALALTASVIGCSVQRGDDSASSGEAAAGGSCSAEGVTQGVSDDAIKLGFMGPLTGGAANLGNGTLAGLELAIDQANEAGGVQGRQLELISKDDQYDAGVAQRAIRELDTNDEIFLLSGGVGTPNFVGIMPYLEQNGITAIGPYAPSNQVGVIESPETFMIWPNFTDEFTVGMRYINETQSPESVALVRMEGDVGDDGLRGLETALDGSGVEVDPILTVEADTVDFTSIAQTLKNENPDTVVLISPSDNIGQMIKAMHAVDFHPQTLGQSDMNDASFLDAFGSDAEGMIITSMMTPLTSDRQEIVDFIADFEEKNGETPSHWNQVGYVQGLVTIEALQNAEHLTRECVVDALENMTEFDTGFIPPITFSPDSRQGTAAVMVGTIEDSSVTQLADFQPVAAE